MDDLEKVEGELNKLPPVSQDECVVFFEEAKGIVGEMDEETQKHLRTIAYGFFLKGYNSGVRDVRARPMKFLEPSWN